VDNVVLVAIVDARQNLLHKDGGILLCELSSGDDLVEKLSSFADPERRKLKKECVLLCDNVVALLVLEEFVHLDNVGVVL
jgi:hypothetical protein